MPQAGTSPLTQEIARRTMSLPIAFRLDQALDNLVVNALRHTPEGGRIELRARHVGDDVQLTVWDSAGAIAAEHLPHVFDRFYKVESAKRHRLAR